MLSVLLVCHERLLQPRVVPHRLASACARFFSFPRCHCLVIASQCLAVCLPCGVLACPPGHVSAPVQGTVSVVASFVRTILGGCRVCCPRFAPGAGVASAPPALSLGRPRPWVPVLVQVLVQLSLLLHAYVQVQGSVQCHNHQAYKHGSTHFPHMYFVSLSSLLLVVQGPWPVC